MAKKSLKNAPSRNLEGALLAEWNCPYYTENYCNNKGHTDYRLMDCYMYEKPKELRANVVEELERVSIVIEMDFNAIEGKST